MPKTTFLVALVQVEPQFIIWLVAHPHPSMQSMPRYGSHLAQTWTVRIAAELDHVPITNEPLKNSSGTGPRPHPQSTRYILGTFVLKEAVQFNGTKNTGLKLSLNFWR